jgi:uncharacterized membrane protein YecN with MAPEG domain
MSLASAWIAAPLLLLIAGLGLWVSRLRIGGVARADEKRFVRWQRAHGNAVEHVPFAVLVLFLFELAGGPRAVVLAIGVTLLVARLLHAWGTGAPHKQAKLAGATLTYIVEVVLAGALFWQII